MHSLNSFRALLATVFQIPLAPLNAQSIALRAHTAQKPLARLPSSSCSRLPSRPFSTTSQNQARKKNVQKPDRRVTLIRYHLHHPTTLTPRPLRFSRTRYLRHWTIHRAWLLFNRNRRQARELELERQYNAMRAACEELRTGVGDGGKLFRRSMMKGDLWQLGAVPKEYTKGQVEYWGIGGGVQGKKGVWNEGWKRVGAAPTR